MKTVKHQRNRIVASSLVYTLFVLAVPLVKGAGWTAWGATLVSVPLFVYAYGSFFRDSTTRRALVWLGVMAALGFALVLVNLGGTTYIVYAAALAPIALNPKSSMIVFALLAAGMGAEMTLVGGPDGLAIGGWVILLIFVVGGPSGKRDQCGAACASVDLPRCAGCEQRGCRAYGS